MRYRAKITYKKTQGKLHTYHSSQISIKSESFDTETRQKYDVIIKSHNNENEKMNSINYKIGNV